SGDQGARLPWPCPDVVSDGPTLFSDDARYYCSPLGRERAEFVAAPDRRRLRRFVQVDVVVGAGGIAAQTQALAVEILDVHPAPPPGKIGRLLADDGAAAPVVGIERVDVVDENRDPRARRALGPFAQKDFHSVAAHAGEGRRRSEIPLLLEAELVHVVVDG